MPLQEQEHTMQIMLHIAVKMVLDWFSPQEEIKQQPPRVRYYVVWTILPQVMLENL